MVRLFFFWQLKEIILFFLMEQKNWKIYLQTDRTQVSPCCSPEYMKITKDQPISNQWMSKESSSIMSP